MKKRHCIKPMLCNNSHMYSIFIKFLAIQYYITASFPESMYFRKETTEEIIL